MVRGALFAVRCWLSVACVVCSFVGCCVLLPVGVVRCLMFVVCLLLLVIRWWLCVVCCFGGVVILRFC